MAALSKRKLAAALDGSDARGATAYALACAGRLLGSSLHIGVRMFVMGAIHRVCVHVHACVLLNGHL
jgi:hypothetical protein